MRRAPVDIPASCGCAVAGRRPGHQRGRGLHGARAPGPGLPGPRAAGWQGVTATALDASTVRFDLAVPLGASSRRRRSRSCPPTCSPASRSPISPTRRLLRLVGNGPFALTDLSQDAARLEPVLTPVDPGYGPLATLAPGDVVAGGPLLSGLELRFYDSPTDAIAAYRAGDVDAVSGLAPASAAPLATDAGTRLINYPGRRHGRLPEPAARAGPFADARVRVALLAAIDRNRLVTDLLAGSGQRADTPIPPSSWAFDPKATPAVASPDGGGRRTPRRWLDEVRDGLAATEGKAARDDRAPCRDASVNGVTARAAARVAAAWTSLGIPTTVTSLEAGALVERLRGGVFMAAVADINVGLDPDPYPLLAAPRSRPVVRTSRIPGPGARHGAQRGPRAWDRCRPRRRLHSPGGAPGQARADPAPLLPRQRVCRL